MDMSIELAFPDWQALCDEDEALYHQDMEYYVSPVPKTDVYVMIAVPREGEQFIRIVAIRSGRAGHRN